jgi:hypothetical protein
VVGDSGENNGHYLQRLAELAVDRAKEPELCASLVRTIGIFGRWRSGPYPRSDSLAAAKALDQLYKRTDSDSVRKEIERAVEYLDPDLTPPVSHPASN